MVRTTCALYVCTRLSICWAEYALYEYVSTIDQIKSVPAIPAGALDHLFREEKQPKDCQDHRRCGSRLVRSRAHDGSAAQLDRTNCEHPRLLHRGVYRDFYCLACNGEEAPIEILILAECQPLCSVLPLSPTWHPPPAGSFLARCASRR